MRKEAERGVSLTHRLRTTGDEGQRIFNLLVAFSRRTLAVPVLGKQPKHHDGHISVILLDGIVEDLVAHGVQDFRLAFLNEVEILSLERFGGQAWLGRLLSALGLLRSGRGGGLSDVHGREVRRRLSSSSLQAAMESAPPAGSEIKVIARTFAKFPFQSSLDVHINSGIEHERVKYVQIPSAKRPTSAALTPFAAQTDPR